MGQQFDDRQSREKRTNATQDNAQLDKRAMPEQNRQDVQRQLHPSSEKGAVLLNRGISDRSTESGRPAALDPMRQANPAMMALASRMFPELAASQSPQREALIKALENPALIRSYLINPQETAGCLGVRFPDMKDMLAKNMPFQKIDGHLVVNPDSGMYERIKEEVNGHRTPSGSFMYQTMDKLLSSALPASLGGSSGMETKAYELVRHRIEHPNEFTKQGAQIEQRISKLMRSPQAVQDLKVAEGLAFMGPVTGGQPSQPVSKGVPTTNGPVVQGELKPVQGATPVPPIPTPAPGMIPTTTGVQVTGGLTPVPPQVTGPAANTIIPTIAGGTAGIPLGASGPKISVPGISIPGIAAAATVTGIGLTASIPPVDAKIPVPAPTKPPVAASPQTPSSPPTGAVPTTNGPQVKGELKAVGSGAPLVNTPPAPTKPEETKVQATPQKPVEEVKALAPTPNPVNERIAQENKELKEMITKLNDTLTKNADVISTVNKKLQESEARVTAAEAKVKESDARVSAADTKVKETTEALLKRLEESDRRAARAELRGEVNEQLRDNKQKIASSKELDEAVKALARPAQKDLPGADEVVAKIAETRKAAEEREAQLRRDLGAKINASMSALPANANIKQTREWTDSNMTLFKSLEPQGQKAFVEYIQTVYKFQPNQENLDPMNFFNRRLADSVALELRSATKSETFRPLPMGPGAIPQPITVYSPDLVKITEVLRSIDDLPTIKPYVRAHPDVAALKDKLPKDGWFFKEDGVFQKSIDARLENKPAEAEAYLIRSLISSGAIKTKEQRQKIQEARSADPSRTAAIDEFYKKTFGSDIKADIKTANAAAIEKAKTADAEVKAAQERAKKLKDETGDLLE